MSRSYWLSIFAVVGWLVLAEQTIPNQANAQGQEAQDQAKTTEPSLPVRILEQPKQSEADKRSQQEAAEREKQDLSAQQAMASGTKWLVWLSIAQIVLAFFGTIALIYSILLNRRATNAAVQANSNTIIAIEQEQANAQRQLRAYILVRECRIDSFFVGLVPKAVVTIENFGQTPAAKMVGVINIHITQTEDENNQTVADEEFFAVRESESPLAPSGKVPMTIETKEVVSEHNFQQVISGAKSVFVFGRIEYVDSFDEPRRTEFRFRGVVRNGRLSESFNVCANGNFYS